MAFIILRRTKNTLAEQTVTFGFIGTIVNGFGFQNLTIRIFQDFFGRSQSDGYLRKVTLYFRFFSKSHVSYLYIKELLRKISQE